jgi:hypothetical protein
MSRFRFERTWSDPKHLRDSLRGGKLLFASLGIEPKVSDMVVWGRFRDLDYDKVYEVHSPSTAYPVKTVGRGGVHVTIEGKTRRLEPIGTAYFLCSFTAFDPNITINKAD